MSVPHHLSLLSDLEFPNHDEMRSKEVKVGDRVLKERSFRKIMRKKTKSQVSARETTKETTGFEMFGKGAASNIKFFLTHLNIFLFFRVYPFSHPSST